MVTVKQYESIVISECGGKVIHQQPPQSRVPKPLEYLRRKRASDRSGIRGIVKAVGRRTPLPMSESTIGDTDFCEKKPKRKTSFRCVCQAKKERKAKKNPQNHLFLRIFGAGKTFGKPKADLNLHEIAFTRTWWLRHLSDKSTCPHELLCTQYTIELTKMQLPSQNRMNYHRTFSSTSPISPSTQIALSAISLGQNTSPRLTQA